MARLEERSITKRFAAVCPCETCKRGRGDKNRIKHKDIESYSATPPGGWRLLHTLAETRQVQAGGPQPWYMGVELETMVPADKWYEKYRTEERAYLAANASPTQPVFQGTDTYHDFISTPAYIEYEAAHRVWSRTFSSHMMDYERRFRGEEGPTMTGEEGASMARPNAFWLAKHDSSVTGPEFASMPASLAWWYSRRPQFEAMFASLLHAGFRSHEGDKCGLHVNISLTAFADSKHLARFASLVNLNDDFSLKMSQRTRDSASHWAQMGTDTRSFRSISRIEEWAYNVSQYGDGGESERYVALNTPGKGRLEFRLPRGTLRVDRFYKNLEWVHSMVEFTRQFGDVGSVPYVTWLMSREDYPDLRAFIEERNLVPAYEVVPERYEVPAIASRYTALMSTAATAMAGSFGRHEDDDEWDDDEDRCPCGDGCYRNECVNCEEEAPLSYAVPISMANPDERWLEGSSLAGSYLCTDRPISPGGLFCEQVQGHDGSCAAWIGPMVVRAAWVEQGS